MKGEKNGNARLTPADVQAIRQAHAGLMRELATRYGVSRSYLTKLINRGRWPHLGEN